MERGKMAGDTSDNKTRIREHKERLVKSARMYAMCRKAGVADPLDVVGLAMAAFEEVPLQKGFMFVRSNQQDIEDLAWAFKNSNSAEEFEQRIKEIKQSPNGRRRGAAT